MKGRTSFSDAKFLAPPQCFNAKFLEGTTWDGVQWPRATRNAHQLKEFIGAYERLKLEMDRLKKHGDELDFFARELQCQQVVLGWKGLPITLYGVLCGYGRYYVRPLAILVVVRHRGRCLDPGPFPWGLVSRDFYRAPYRGRGTGSQLR
jgi:hypothetical protein